MASMPKLTNGLAYKLLIFGVQPSSVIVHLQAAWKCHGRAVAFSETRHPRRGTPCDRYSLLGVQHHLPQASIRGASEMICDRRFSQVF